MSDEEEELGIEKPSKFKRFLSFLGLIPVYFYRGAIKPMIGSSCLFTPTCSEYAIIAIKRHGVFRGWWLATRRILRCNPFNRVGFGPDPVPPKRIKKKV